MGGVYCTHMKHQGQQMLLSLFKSRSAEQDVTLFTVTQCLLPQRALATERSCKTNSVMKKNSGSSQKLGSFLSPGAPSYREKSVESQKGWSSERMLQPASSSRRQSSVASSGLTPFNSGRTIPSKWDDAERWICSPVSSSYANNQHQLPRRPKSKSGPIMPPGAGYYSNYSPAIPLRRQSMVVKNLMMGSPFSTGVLAPDALSLHHYYAAHDTVFSPLYDDDDDIDNEIQYSSSELNQNGVALPSVSSAPMWSELLCDPSSPNFQDEKCNGTKNEETEVSPFLRRDQGTQMSLPETENDSAHSSAKSSPSLAMNPKNCNSSKLEVRDVQVDNQAPVNKWSKQNHLHDEDLQRSSKEAQASSLDSAESTLNISKFHREEAKIIAWESLQKAKAEAAIRKLEMKLEKKRSSSMDKILKKLRRAQMKAEKMRSLTPVQQQGHRVCKTWKVFSFPKWSPSRCFSSHAL